MASDMHTNVALITDRRWSYKTILQVVVTT